MDRDASLEPYRARRARLADVLRRHGGGVAIVPTAPERQRNGDNDHPYRHGSDFHYLTGFAEPGAWLVVEADGRTTLVCRPKDIEREIWDGYRLGPDAAPAVLGVDAALPLDELDRLMREKIANQPSVWIPSGMPGLQAQLDGWLERIRARERQGDEAPRVQHDLAAVLAEMRIVKDAGELATMRRAAAISAGAHARAMRFCAETLPPRSAGRHSRIRDRGRAAARVPPPRRRRPGLRLDRRRRRQRLRPPLRAVAHRAAPRPALPDRRRLRARRLRQRRHPHLSRRRPLHAGAARALRHRRGGADRGPRRHPPRRAPARRPRRGGAGAGAGHARHRPARPRHRSATSTR